MIVIVSNISWFYTYNFHGPSTNHRILPEDLGCKPNLVYTNKWKSVNFYINFLCTVIYLEFV